MKGSLEMENRISAQADTGVTGPPVNTIIFHGFLEEVRPLFLGLHEVCRECGFEPAFYYAPRWEDLMLITRANPEVGVILCHPDSVVWIDYEDLRERRPHIKVICLTSEPMSRHTVVPTPHNREFPFPTDREDFAKLVAWFGINRDKPVEELYLEGYERILHFPRLRPEDFTEGGGANAKTGRI